MNQATRGLLPTAHDSWPPGPAPGLPFLGFHEPEVLRRTAAGERLPGRLSSRRSSAIDEPVYWALITGAASNLIHLEIPCEWFPHPPPRVEALAKLEILSLYFHVSPTRRQPPPLEIWLIIVSIANTPFSSLHLHATLPDHLRFSSACFSRAPPKRGWSSRAVPWSVSGSVAYKPNAAPTALWHETA